MSEFNQCMPDSLPWEFWGVARNRRKTTRGGRLTPYYAECEAVSLGADPADAFPDGLDHECILVHVLRALAQYPA